MPEGALAYIETPAVCRLASIRPSTLDYWVRTGLVNPSIRGGIGRRATRRWSVADTIAVRALKALRDAGCPLQMMRKAQARLAEQWLPTLRGRLLYWDGRDLMEIGPWRDVESLVKFPGQQILQLVALPLDLWTQEAQAEVVDLQRPLKRRGGGQQRRAHEEAG